MHPLVEADKMAGIEGRPQPATGQGRDHRFVYRATFDTDSCRLVPGDQSVEISLGHLQESGVGLGDEAAAGRQATPVPDRGGCTLAAPRHAGCRAAQADDGAARIVGGEHRMAAHRFAGIAHAGRGRELAITKGEACDDPPDRHRCPRRSPFGLGDLVCVDHGPQALDRVHQHAGGVHDVGRPDDRGNGIDDERRGEEGRLRQIPLLAFEILPADDADRVAGPEPSFAQNRDKIRLLAAILAHQAQ
ncbi:MAG: hypothetical protein EOS81_01225 [Mesorhizobium sp.]|nr:MAG: hypothetical protein EOS81_01225 [Mesorhizobium sp.]